MKKLEKERLEKEAERKKRLEEYQKKLLQRCYGYE